MRPRSWFLVAAVALVGCKDLGKTVEVKLSPIGGSGASGTATLENTICKSECVQFSMADVELAETVAEVRRGTCAAPGEPIGGGLPTDGMTASVAMTAKIAELSGKASIWLIDAVTGAALACGDIP